MATVQDLLDALEPKILGYQDAIVPAGLDPVTELPKRKISYLNEAQHEVWKTLVGIGREFDSHWFTKEQPITAGAGEKDFSLPADFHQILMLEATDATWRETRFEKRGFHNPQFLSGRYSAAGDLPVPTAGNPNAPVVYAVGRANPAKLYLSHSFPGVQLQGLYVYTLANLTAASDSIDDLLPPYAAPLTNYAAEQILRSVHEVSLSEGWGKRWGGNVTAMREAASRGLPPSDAVAERDYAGA